MVSGASFPEAYQVCQYWTDPVSGEEVVYHEYLVVPNVGIVGMKTHVPLYRPREAWELISYSIPGRTR